MIGGRVLDTSALEHFATSLSVYARALVWALVWAAVEHSDVLVVPTTALTMAWARIPTEACGVLEVLLGLPDTVIEVLDPPTAHEVGLFLGAAGGRSDPPGGSSRRSETTPVRITWYAPTVLLEVLTAEQGLQTAPSRMGPLTG